MVSQSLAMAVCCLAAAAALAQDAPPTGAPAPEVPPYVIVPDPRPWEDEAFRQEPLRYTIRDAVPSEARPSYTAGEAGLAKLEKGSGLVFHSPGRAELAAQVVDLLERQHRLLAYYTQ